MTRARAKKVEESLQQVVATIFEARANFETKTFHFFRSLLTT